MSLFVHNENRTKKMTESFVCWKQRTIIKESGEWLKAVVEKWWRAKTTVDIISPRNDMHFK